MRAKPTFSETKSSLASIYQPSNLRDSVPTSNKLATLSRVFENLRPAFFYPCLRQPPRIEGSKCVNHGGGYSVVSTCVSAAATDAETAAASAPQYPYVVGSGAANVTGDEVCKTGPVLPEISEGTPFPTENMLEGADGLRRPPPPVCDLSVQELAAPCFC